MSRIFFLFFLTGLSGLLYEIIWLRQISLSFGATMPAMATILSSFMAGLGLGAFIGGRLSARLQRPVRAYALIEGAVGLTGLGMTLLFFHLGWASRLLESLSGGSPGLMIAVRVIMLFLLILIPTTLMGSTLPILTSALNRRDPQIVRVVSRLYGINAAGAVTACLLVDLWLVPGFGVVQTGLFAAGLNILVALLALNLDSGEQSAPKIEVTPAGAPPESSPGLWWWAALAGLSGACGMAFETLIGRFFLFLTSSRIYAFSIMLAVFLAGLSSGSLVLAPWLARRAKSAGDERLAAGLASILAGFGILLAIYLGGRISPWLVVLIRSVESGPNIFFTPYKSLFASLSILFLPALGLGAVFPLIVKHCHRGPTGAGFAVGLVYSVNTIGSIIGSLAGVFLLLPFCGVQAGLQITGGLMALAGAGLLAAAKGRVIIRTAAIAAAAIMTTAALLLPADDLVRRTYYTLVREPGEKLVHFDEGLNEAILIKDQFLLGRLYQRWLYTDRTPMSATGLDGRRYMKLMAHLPVLLGRNPESALLICHGVGNTLNGLTRHERLKEIWDVDISDQIFQASRRFFNNNDGALLDPRVRTRTADGRHFLLTTNQTFDLITSEPPPPAARGVVNLYSREYYQLAASRLRPGGLVCQWLPVAQMPPFETLTLIRAFIDVFPHAALWSGTATELILLGGKEPIEVSWPELIRRIKDPRVARDLESIGVRDAYDLLALLNADSRQLRALVRNSPACTDNRPYIEYADFKRMDFDFAVKLSRLQADPSVLVTDRGVDPEEKQKHFKRLSQAVAVSRLIKNYSTGVSIGPDGKQEMVRTIDMTPPALTVLPDTPAVRSVLRIEKEYVKAARDILAKDPDHFQARLMIAREAYFMGNFQLAREHLDRLARLRPGDRQALIFRAYTYEQLGLKDEAAEMFKKMEDRP